MSAPVLELDGVEAAYGPFRALFGVSLSVAEHEAVAVLGPNGAGKTTTARVASGLVAPSAGLVRLGGETFTGRRPFEYARAGVLHAPEGRSVFATFSVRENLVLSLEGRRSRSEVAEALDEAFELFPVLGERRDQLAGTLSGGEQRMLAMARVLVEAPQLLIADELSLGLAPIVIDEIYATLARIKEAGTAMLIVEQQVAHALQLCDRVLVMDNGLVSWQGPPDEAADEVALRLFDTTG